MVIGPDSESRLSRPWINRRMPIRMKRVTSTVSLTALLSA